MRCEYCQAEDSDDLCVSAATADPEIKFCDECLGAYLRDPRCTDENAVWRSDQCNRCLAYAGDYRLSEGHLCEACVKASCDRCDERPAVRGGFFCANCEKPGCSFTAPIEDVPAIAARLMEQAYRFRMDALYDANGVVADQVSVIVPEADPGKVNDALRRRTHIKFNGMDSMPTTSMKERF